MPPPASNPRSAPPVPTEIVATGSKRTITISWEDAAGDASYTIAVRPKNGTEPLEWVEYSATSSPYSISDNLVMSGLEYELRLFAVNYNGRSEWSKIATVSVPALQQAPSGAVGTDNVSLYYVGDIMAVHLHSQRPFEKRSVWHWFLCNSDGTNCKLLPVPKSPTYLYHVPEIARGKLIKVQVDYDKDGESYSATNIAGVVHETDRLWANVTNGRIKIFWDESEKPSTTNYRIKIRPKNSTQPLQWTEHLATSFPYVILDYQVMSGLEYEIQIATLNADQQSESLKNLEFTVPDLPAAPPTAIQILTEPPYRSSDVVHVSLASQHPFTSRSAWHWFLCDTDGAECKLLPPKQANTHRLLIPDIARGKLIKVQSDYRKDGIAYTASATIGIVNQLHDSDATTTMPNPAPTYSSTTECPEEPTSQDDQFLFSVETSTQSLQSLLYATQLKFVRTQWDRYGGGAIEAMCHDLLLATPWGRIAVVRPNGSVEYLNAQVPMNLEAFWTHPDASKIYREQLRVADILLKQHSSQLWELLITHHYFTGECLRFRLSSTTVIRNGNNIEVSPAWRTIFDAEPCMPLNYIIGLRTGGSMLVEGSDHLLIVTGDHGIDGRNTWVVSQDPESHLGKLLRVEIETGEAEILASGLRNSQGLVRDQYGNIWATDHGGTGGDELNLMKEDNNYGWPIVSYGLKLHKTDKVGSHDGFTPPIFSWIPSIAPSSIIMNNPQAFPLWKDDLLIASLSGSYNAGHSLFRVRRADTEIRYVERINLGWRIRDITQMPNGQIAILRDDGRVYFMSRDYSYCHDETLPNEHIYKIDCTP